MEIGNILNSKSPKFTKATPADPSRHDILGPMSQAQVAQQSYPIHDMRKMDTDHSHEISQYDHLGRYSPQSLSHMHSYNQMSSNYNDPYAYVTHGTVSDSSNIHQNIYESTTSYDPNPVGRNQGTSHAEQASPLQHGEMQSLDENNAGKAFACAVCRKGFARRSDLVRHERIHSGVRPHVCPHPGCDKQFIQRSALTVHERVHTGEKPHQCEKCSKPFSDSSSLARHRRTHSGTRPYQCPHQDCLKTFTRRTTLTRHLNHHAGTAEQSTAAKAAALASKAQAQVQDAAQSDTLEGDEQSEASSSAPSQHPDATTYGYPHRVPHTSQYPGQRQNLDFYNTSTHSDRQSRDDIQYTAHQSSSLSPTQHSSYPTQQIRHNITSNPSVLPPPSVLEPPTNPDYKSTKSSSSSPQMASISTQNHPQQVTQQQQYGYPDPLQSPMAYYPSQQSRQMQSYDGVSRDVQHNLRGAYGR